MTDAVSEEASDAVVLSDRELDLKAENLIKNHVMTASAASIVPLPLFDVAAITIVQVRLIAKLAALYGKAFSEHSTRNIIAALGGGVLGHSGGVLTAISLIKVVPVFGWALGMVSMPVVAGGTTYALGRVFARHFKQGGTLADISVENVRGYYNEQLQKGKKVAASLKEGLQKRTAPTATREQTV